MIYRNVSERLEHLADFIEWDPDPYLTITDDGRLVWILDGYTTSDKHPYSQAIRVGSFGSQVNYIRNAVKATVDAYHGTTTIYTFDGTDPIIQSYARVFPNLFQPMEAMPASIREHARYPELIFDIQAELYRTFHMRDPTVFYNREDIWDVGRSLAGDTGAAERMETDLHRGDAAGRDRAGIPADAAVHAAQQGQSQRLGWQLAATENRLGETDLLSAFQAAACIRAEPDRSANQPRAADRPRSDALEPAGLPACCAAR